MATILKTKNSVTTTVVPTTLQQGELAVNITDKKMWVGNAATTPVQIVGNGVAGGAGGSTTQVQYNSSGLLAGSANMTFSGTALTLANDASISGLTVGKGSGGVGTNTAVGVNAVASVTSGGSNTGIGRLSLYGTTTGTTNTAIGNSSAQSNTTGSSNVAVGDNALFSNTTASNNTAVGYQAGYSNTTGTKNTTLGTQAGYSNTNDRATFIGTQAGKNISGVANTFVGNDAGFSAVSATGATNVSIGDSSSYSLSTGSDNVVVGYAAFYANTTGGSNTGLGTLALRFNTTGSNNVAVGRESLYTNTTASNNTAVGYQAGYSNTTATNNVFIGAQTGYANTTGTQNTYIGGYQSGYNITTGSFNTIIGNYNGNSYGLDIRTASGYIVLSDGYGNPRGYFDNGGIFLVGTTTTDIWTGSATNTGFKVEASGTTTIARSGFASLLLKRTTASTGNIVEFAYGTTQVGSISTNGTITSYNVSSDQRLKENIVNAPDASSNIDAIQVRSFDYISDKSSVKYGFIAQELVTVAPDAVYQPSNPDEMMGVDYSKLVPMMIKEIQSLRKRVALLESK